MTGQTKTQEGKRERIASVRQHWLNDLSAEAGEPQPFTEFEPCSHCGGETIEECNFLCPIHDGRLSEPCHGESAGDAVWKKVSEESLNRMAFLGLFFLFGLSGGLLVAWMTGWWR